MIPEHMTKPYLEKCKALRRKVLRGFPWSGKFTTKEEIEDYFTDDGIQCLLCGKWLETFSTHLQRIHGTTKKQYCSIFGLPLKRGLACKDLEKWQGHHDPAFFLLMSFMFWLTGQLYTHSSLSVKYTDT